MKHGSTEKALLSLCWKGLLVNLLLVNLRAVYSMFLGEQKLHVTSDELSITRTYRVCTQQCSAGGPVLFYTSTCYLVSDLVRIEKSTY